MPRMLIFVVLFGLVGAIPLGSRGGDAPAGAKDGPQTLPNVRPPGLDWGMSNADPDQRQRMLRFSTFVNGEVPDKYMKAENTVGYTVRAIAEGGTLYATHCRQCHGTLGLGNGDLAYALEPSPALLAYLVDQPVAVDQYLLWSISEGGKPFGTAMPSFKDRLSREQIFQIVAYLRAGFPDLEDEPAPKTGPGAAETDEPDDRTHDIE